MKTKIEDFQPNDEQRAVIESPASQILCIAGAGSGKTATLAARIRRLLERCARPGDIVAITYTNAAARELRDRIGCQLGFIGTLHSFMLREIRTHHELLGLPGTISILDDDGKIAVAEWIAKEMKLREPMDRLLEEVANPRWIEPVAKGTPLSKLECAAVEYHRTLRRNGVLDFDAILHHGKRLAARLAEKQHKGEPWRARHLFVDEYQDSSDVDAWIYENMPFMSRFFVGDPDQAIYGFRGGNVANIVRLSEDDGYRVFTLQNNYRCRATICCCAQALVERNELRYPKSTIAVQPGGDITVTKNAIPASELCNLLAPALRAADAGRSFAVLSRTNHLAEEVSKHLEASGVKVARRAQVAKPVDWRAAKLWLALVQNPHNDFLAHQYLVAKVGEKEANLVRTRCALNHVSINEGFLKIASSPGDCVPSLNQFSAEARERVHVCARRLSDAGEWTIQDLLLALNAEDESREEDGQGVVVTTMHASKGREWDEVVLVGCEEGSIPSLRSGSNLEEERRLFYVAMTRARQFLTISWCENRPQSRGPNMKPGPLEVKNRSRFVEEAGI